MNTLKQITKGIDEALNLLRYIAGNGSSADALSADQIVKELLTNVSELRRQNEDLVKAVSHHSWEKQDLLDQISKLEKDLAASDQSNMGWIEANEILRAGLEQSTRDAADLQFKFDMLQVKLNELSKKDFKVFALESPKVEVTERLLDTDCDEIG